MSPSSTSEVDRKVSLKRVNSGRASPTASTFQNVQNALANGRRVPNNTAPLAFDEDRGLVMREREKDRADRDEASIGKAGGRAVGVTRPKRRLSRELVQFEAPAGEKERLQLLSQCLPTPQTTRMITRSFVMSAPSISPSSPRLPVLPRPFNSASSLSPRHPHFPRIKLTDQSLPSLPHPIHSSRALSTSSPPASPNGQSHHHHQVPQSTYLSLQSSLSGPGYGKMDEKAPSTSYAATPTREKDGPPRLFGIDLKWISLITLALQNAFLTIIMHYSRITTSPNETYSAASAVLLNELLKGSVSVAMALRNIDRSMSAPSHPLSEKGPRHIAPRPSPASRWPTFLHLSRLRSLRQAVLSPDCYKLSIPAILYVIQNNLQYVAASNLDVATFQVTYQMKILTTAFFSVLLLRKRLSTSKWASLVLLAVGVAIVQLQTTSSSSVSSDSGVKVIKGTALRSEIPDVAEAATIVAHPRVMHPLKGFLAVTLACMTSGLAGVYFEFLLKVSPSASNHPPPDLWVRNTQLSLFSLVPAIVPILINPSGPEGVGWLGRVMMSFSNFNGWAIGTVLTQTFGGLITAIVIRYSDNIMKGFATSLSIIISFLASVILFSYPITATFIFGSSVVLLATFMYNNPSSSPSTPVTRKEVAVAPGSPIGPRAPIIGEPEPPSRTSSVISLLGLGTSSSRKNSSTDLKTQASGFGLTPQHTHVYAASAPGTPYLSSGHPSNASMYDGRVSPNFALPPRARSPAGPPPVSTSANGSASASASTPVSGGSSSGEAGRGSPRPDLKLDMGSS